MRGQLIERGVHRFLEPHYNAIRPAYLANVQMRNRKKHTDEKRSRNPDNSQPKHYEPAFILARWRGRDAKHERTPSKNACQRLDHVSAFTHSMTAASAGCIVFESRLALGPHQSPRRVRRAGRRFVTSLSPIPSTNWPATSEPYPFRITFLRQHSAHPL